MNPREPFTPADLAELDDLLLARATAVVSLREVHAGNRHADVIGLRHDVDGVSAGALNALPTALRLARWEADRGYRSTYYLLHGAPYWVGGNLQAAVEQLSLLGHEVGIHANALADALRGGGDPAQILHDAIGELRGFGAVIRSVVGHGDQICRDAGFANDEMFLECARPNEGEPDRILEHAGRRVQLEPRSLAEFGLDFEAVRVGPRWVNSDSGGRWLFPFEDTVERFGESLRGAAASLRQGQLHLLIHPDWWEKAVA